MICRLVLYTDLLPVLQLNPICTVFLWTVVYSINTVNNCHMNTEYGIWDTLEAPYSTYEIGTDSTVAFLV